MQKLFLEFHTAAGNQIMIAIDQIESIRNDLNNGIVITNSGREIKVKEKYHEIKQRLVLQR